MSETQQRLQAGDTLINDDGSVTIEIEAIDGDVAEITDSRNYHDDGKKPVVDIETAIDNGHFQIVRDSDLTTIKGIGSSTAPKIEAITGCHSPSELVEAYFTESDSSIRSAVRRVDYLNQWIIEHPDSLNVSLSARQMKVMLFLAEFDCNPNHSSVKQTNEIRNKYNNNVDGKQLTTEHIIWGSDGVWVDSANVACLSYSIEGLSDLQPYEIWNSLEPVDSYERDGDQYRFTHDGSVTWVSADYVDKLKSLFTFDLNDTHTHPDGEYPVLIEDTETDLLIALAPRVQSP